jgi:hypothetical protein
MSTKKSPGYQEILAEFVEGVKESEAQWYLIKSLHTDIACFADPLKISADNLQSFFLEGGLGKIRSDDKLFSFQASKFEIFCSMFTIQDACEMTQHKLKGMKTKE